MKKLDARLVELIKNDPQRKINVIIVLDKDIHHTDIETYQTTRLMSTLFSATLNGNEIQEISQKDSVISIELDAEMTAL